MDSIIKVAEEVNNISKKIECSISEKLGQSVIAAYKTDQFHLAVVGEFKRGKSTMVNSLLGVDLLPSDILPTTAVINIIEYSKQECCEVVWKDGQREVWPLCRESLSRFSVEGDINSEDVKYVVIKLTSKLLENGLVIIDTPGVNDISKSRVEVTKDILPNCDAAIFLLDAASPLTKSEADFLSTKLLTYKLNSLLFVISKSDRLDEDELEESLEGALQRIKEVLNFGAELMPYSSREVSIAESKGIEHEYKKKLLEQIERLRKKSNEDKDERQIEKLKLAIHILLKEIASLEAMHELNEEKLEQLRNKVENRLKEDEVKFNNFMSSLEFVGRKTLIKMFEASFSRFLNNMIYEFIDQLRLEQNVEKYWQQVLPVQIERNLRRFTEDKSREIQIYLKKLVQHIGVEYNKNFQLTLALDMKEVGVNIPTWNLEVSDNNKVSSIVEATLPITVGAIAGSLFMPGIGTAIGSAGGQILGSILRDKKNEDLRGELINKLPMYLESTLYNYSSNVYNMLNSYFDKLNINLSDIHEQNNRQNVLRLKGRINENEVMDIDKKKQELSDIKTNIENLEKNITQEK